MERVPDRSKTACYREILQRSPGLLAPLCGMEIPEADPVCSAAGYVLAPALAGFVQWILAQAKKDGIRRLYFLARDGYFPCRAARPSCEAYGISIECRYLYLSRYSLRRPLYHLDREAALHDICRNAVRITPDILLRRAGIAPEKQEGVFHAAKCRAVPPFGTPWSTRPGRRFLLWQDICARKGCLKMFPMPLWTAGGSVPCSNPFKPCCACKKERPS